MKKILLSIFAFTNILLVAQTFSGATGSIPDYPAGQVCFNVNVTGLSSNLYSAFGLVNVTLNITHPYVSDLEIVLKSPTGVQTILSSNNGGAGANYTGTVFTMSAGTNITAGIAPFSGSYIPEDSYYPQNSGQNGNGTWQLCITDEVGLDAGTLNSWSITFGTGATGSTAPAANPPATDAACSAPLICNLNGYTGSTSSTYTWNPFGNAEPSGTAQPTPGPAGTFCGTHVNNSSWIRFMAASTSVNLTLDVFNCTGTFASCGERGVQLALYNNNCPISGSWTYSASTIPPIATGSCTNDEKRPSCYGDGIFGPGNVLSFNNLTIGQIYYIMFDGWNGNQCDYRINVTNGVQVVTITPSANPICEGDTITLTATSPGTLPSYSWSSVPAGTTGTSSVITVNPTVSTVYQLTATGLCGSQVVTLPITVIPRGNPAWTPPSPICINGTPINLNSLITGTTGGSWSGAGVVSTTFNPSSLSAGTYNVTYTTGTFPCNRTQVHPITVLPTPSPTISLVGSSTVCAYQNATLQVTSPVSGSILWNTGATTSTIGVYNSGTYSATVTNINGCSGFASQAFTINHFAQANPNINPTIPVICNGVPVTIGSLTTFPSYLWSNGATTQNTSVSSPGTYTLITLDANNCYDTASVNVVGSTFNIDVTGTGVLCDNQSATLNVSGGSTYNWSTLETGSSISVTGPGTYWATSTNALGCVDADTITIVNSSFDISTSGDLILCPGETTTLTASGGPSYLWNTGATTSSINTSTAGIYVVESIDGFGCLDRDTLFVNNSLFNPLLIGDTVVCNNTPYTLTASGGTNYLWNNSSTSSTISAPLVSTTNFSVVISNGDGCVDTLNSTVHVYTDFNAAPGLLPDNGTTPFNTTILVPITANDALGTGSVSIIGGPSNGSASIAGGDLNYTPNSGFTGYDTIMYASCDIVCLNLCDTTTVIIKVENGVLIFPEFISPNGDASNDFWDIGDVEAYPDNELVIMNRWGDALFQAAPYNNDWYGQHNMGISPGDDNVTDGTYFFVFRKSPNDEPIKGFIEIRK